MEIASTEISGTFIACVRYHVTNFPLKLNTVHTFTHARGFKYLSRLMHLIMKHVRNVSAIPYLLPLIQRNFNFRRNINDLMEGRCLYRCWLICHDSYDKISITYSIMQQTVSFSVYHFKWIRT